MPHMRLQAKRVRDEGCQILATECGVRGRRISVWNVRHQGTLSRMSKTLPSVICALLSRARGAEHYDSGSLTTQIAAPISSSMSS